MSNVEVRVLKVERPNGRVRSVQLAVGNFDISFVKKKGKVRKASVTRYDKNISHPSDLWVPDHQWGPAIDIARGIFS